MDDLPIPESGAEALGLLVVVAILIGLWYLVRQTQHRHRAGLAARRRREEFLRTHRPAEPEDPRELPTRWEPRPDEGDA